MSALQKAVGDHKADVDYLRLLHLASKNLEADVEAALSLLMEDGQCPSPEAVKKLMNLEGPAEVPEMAPLEVTLIDFDCLTPGMMAEAV